MNVTPGTAKNPAAALLPEKKPGNGGPAPPLDNWVTRALQADLEPLKKVAGMLRNHKPLALNWLKAKGRLSGGAVEGWNLAGQTHDEKSPRFQDPEMLETCLISYTWIGAGAGAGMSPQMLLTSPESLRSRAASIRALSP